MSAMVKTKTRIPLVDLGGQYQRIKPEIDAAIQRVLDRAQYVLGPEVEALEQELAAYCGTAHAVAVASGTDALELSLRACGIGSGDEVITTALSFFATAETIAAVGARPVFADIDPMTYTVDARLIERAITPRTKAVVPVHLYGHPCEMEAILSIAQAHRLKVIEDCAQAIGAAWRGRRVGSFGAAGAFSFYPSKNLGAYGDGGAVVTDDPILADQIRMLRFHGSRDRVRHELIARNSRLDEVQAAILRVKLKYLEQWNDARRAHAETYRQTVAQFQVTGLTLPQERPEARHVFHLYPVRVPRRAEFRRALSQQGISTQIHYEIPLHLEPVFASLGYRAGAFPHAERVTEEIVSLPMYPELTPELVEDVVREIRQPSMRGHHVGAELDHPNVFDARIACRRGKRDAEAEADDCDVLGLGM